MWASIPPRSESFRVGDERFVLSGKADEEAFDRFAAEEADDPAGLRFDADRVEVEGVVVVVVVVGVEVGVGIGTEVANFESAETDTGITTEVGTSTTFEDSKTTADVTLAVVFLTSDDPGCAKENGVR